MAIIRFSFLDVDAQLNAQGANLISFFFKNINKKSLPLYLIHSDKPFIDNAGVLNIKYSNSIDLTSSPIETGEIITNAFIRQPSTITIDLTVETGETLQKLNDAMRNGYFFYIVIQNNIVITPVVITSINHGTLDKTTRYCNISIELEEVELSDPKQLNNI